MLLVIGPSLSFTHALACSCVDTLEAGFVGRETSQRPARVPANTEGIAWYVSRSAKLRRDESVFGDRQPAGGGGRVSKKNAGIVNGGYFKVATFKHYTFHELPARVSHAGDFSTPTGDFLVYVIAPSEGLTPGATYTVTHNLATMVPRGLVERRVVVTIDHEVLSADTPFTLDIGPPTTKIIDVAATGSCSSGHKVSEARIISRLPPVADAWRDQLLYRTIVDGEPWQPRGSICQVVEPGRSWDDVGADRIFAYCETSDTRRSPDTPPGATQGRRAVAMEAYLPGTDIVLKTPLKYVDLDCSGLVEQGG